MRGHGVDEPGRLLRAERLPEHALVDARDIRVLEVGLLDDAAELRRAVHVPGAVEAAVAVASSTRAHFSISWLTPSVPAMRVEMNPMFFMINVSPPPGLPRKRGRPGGALRKE